jgi:hypothetical protein
MRTTTLLILALVFGVRLSRADTTWSSYTSTNRFDFIVTDASIAKTPAWRENADHPPLSAGEALRLGRAELSKLISNSKEWTLETLILKPWRDGQHWVYLVRFEPPLPAGGLDGFQFDMLIPVLMSGVAVEPKISVR